MATERQVATCHRCIQLVILFVSRYSAEPHLTVTVTYLHTYIHTPLLLWRQNKIVSDVFTSVTKVFLYSLFTAITTYKSSKLQVSTFKYNPFRIPLWNRHQILICLCMPLNVFAYLCIYLCIHLFIYLCIYLCTSTLRNTSTKIHLPRSNDRWIQVKINLHKF